MYLILLYKLESIISRIFIFKYEFLLEEIDIFKFMWEGGDLVLIRIKVCRLFFYSLLCYII